MPRLLPVSQRPSVLASRAFEEHAEELAGRDLPDTFEYIYENNIWGSPESQSGEGSELAATAQIRAKLPVLLRRYGMRTLLDAPCGDFGWMSYLDLPGVMYTGVDVVRSLVERNKQSYGSGSRRFMVRDIVTDSLPEADLVMCRDCLVHLSYREISLALRNFRRSGSKYLLTTTFTEVDENRDITTGDWRPLNLCQPPLNFPEPAELIIEDCEEAGGAYADKALGLWALGSITSDF